MTPPRVEAHDEQPGRPRRMRDRITPEIRAWAKERPLSEAAAANVRQIWRRWRRDRRESA